MNEFALSVLSGRTFKIIGCDIFRHEMESVAPEIASQTTWLPAGLHVDFGRLKDALQEATQGDEHVVCLYGAACHPDMNDLVASHRGCHLPGRDCVAAFLPDEARRKLEGRKAFVMTPGWLRNWREIFCDGCGWDEVDARQNFGLYDVVVLLDFGVEPIDDMAVLEFFEYVRTPVDIEPADLEYFLTNVKRLIKAEGDERDGADLDR